MHATTPAVAAVFDPVQAVTTFEETVERLGTGIRLGLLPPGSQLPPERELAEQMGISRSSLRQALTALTQSGHLVSVRGRGGGWFVAEVGWVMPAAERADDRDITRLAEQVETMRAVDDFTVFRQADVFFHLAL